MNRVNRNASILQPSNHAQSVNPFMSSPPGIYCNKFLSKQRGLFQHPVLVPSLDTLLGRATKHKQDRAVLYCSSFLRGTRTQRCLNRSYHLQYGDWSATVWKWACILNNCFSRSLYTNQIPSAPCPQQTETSQDFVLLCFGKRATFLRATWNRQRVRGA